MESIKIFISCVIIALFIAQSTAFIDKIQISRQENHFPTTHSESHRPIHVPIFERSPVNVPHPVPIAVPQYIKISIPHPVPHYTKVQHPIEVPVYRIVPEIVEKPLPYTVEKPFPIEIEKPFPIEVIRKFQVPIPKPYPIHTILYKHINEDDSAPRPKRNHKLSARKGSQAQQKELKRSTASPLRKYYYPKAPRHQNHRPNH